jgi:hypothetical protein
MKTLRLFLSGTTIFLLLAGYCASQVAAMNGTVADYAHKVDQAPIRGLALILLLAACVLALVPERTEGP